MKTVLVSGNDTGVGKTWIVAELARALSSSEVCAQVVKPVETGVGADVLGDAQTAIEGCASSISAHRFFAFSKPLAPLTAAQIDGQALSMQSILDAMQTLPDVDVRVIEGAGGLAVPLDEEGSDWADLAQVLCVDTVVLVVENRLGAINQARLLEHYAHAKGLSAVFVLNTIQPLDAETDRSNRAAIGALRYPLLSVDDVVKRLMP